MRVNRRGAFGVRRDSFTPPRGNIIGYYFTIWKKHYDIQKFSVWLVLGTFPVSLWNDLDDPVFDIEELGGFKSN